MRLWSTRPSDPIASLIRSCYSLTERRCTAWANTQMPSKSCEDPWRCVLDGLTWELLVKVETNVGSLDQAALDFVGIKSNFWSRRASIQTMRWSIDGKEIGTLDPRRDGRFSSDGHVTLGYTDPYPSMADDPTLVFGLVDNLMVTGDVPFSDDFNTDSSGRYSIIVSSPDTRITFAYDYSRVGIPPAPNTTDGTTLGLKLEANLERPESREFLTLHTVEEFSGTYTVRFDAWMNTVGPFPDLVSGATEFLTAGVGADGHTANQFAPNQLGSFTGSGGWTAVTGDGGTYIRDYRMYKDDNEQFAFYSAAFAAGVGVGNGILPKTLASALCSQDDSDPYYAGYGLPSFEWFYLAMSHWQLGERKQARRAYERAIEFMEAYEADKEVARLQRGSREDAERRVQYKHDALASELFPGRISDENENAPSAQQTGIVVCHPQFSAQSANAQADFVYSFGGRFLDGPPGTAT